MDAMQPDNNWKTCQKILFRFFVLFLFLLSQVAFNPFLNILGYGYRKQVQLINVPLKTSVDWLDDNVFQIGYLREQHATYLSDTHFCVVLFMMEI